jgi:hypothetical protein
VFCSLPVHRADSGEGRKTPLEITAAGTVADSHGIPFSFLPEYPVYGNQRQGKGKKMN